MISWSSSGKPLVKCGGKGIFLLLLASKLNLNFKMLQVNKKKNAWIWQELIEPALVLILNDTHVQCPIQMYFKNPQNIYLVYMKIVQADSV